MFKLLIADDEKLERDALRFIISKSIDSITAFEEAVNGREAIDKALTTNPDIIILDINMPGVNGIEAAWSIREANESACIIFLTAFHQFDYAHEAIKVGADDYIVKPSSEKRIIEVMEKITFRLMERKAEKQKRSNLESRLDKISDHVGSEFIYDLATRNLEEGKFRNYLTLLDMDFHKGRGCVMRLIYDSYPIQTSLDYQKQVLKKRCLRLLKSQFEQHDLFCSYNMDLNNSLILIYSDRYNRILESDEALLNVIQSVTGNIKSDLDIDVLLGFGSLFNSGHQATRSFSEAKKGLSERNERTPQSCSDEGFSIELEMDLEQAVVGGDKEKLEELFMELEERIQLSPASFEEKKNRLLDLTVILRHSTAVQFPKRECLVDTEQMAESGSLFELLTAFKDLLNDLLDRIADLYADENIPVIKKACEYIHENYHREINLEDTAAYCNLSTFYFSKIFKEHKKKNFIHYLTEIRISEAKRLLKETEMTMKEISARIGYRDPNYFTRVFKRVENCSPKYFRNNKMLKQQ